MIIRNLILLACFHVCFALADHLPESKILLGKADTLLSGIDVYHSTIRTVVAELGQPMSSKVIREKDDIAGGKQYEWKVGSLKLVVTTWNDKGEDSVPYSVEIWGAQPKGNLGATGRGLKLGASLKDVRGVYGPRFVKRFREDGTLQVVIQWADDTTLYLYLNQRGRVDRMQLAAAVE